MSNLTLGERDVEDWADDDLLEWCRIRASTKDYRPHPKTLSIWRTILRTFDAIGTPRLEGVHGPGGGTRGECEMSVWLR